MFRRDLQSAELYYKDFNSLKPLHLAVSKQGTVNRIANPYNKNRRIANPPEQSLLCFVCFCVLFVSLLPCFVCFCVSAVSVFRRDLQSAELYYKDL